MQTPWLQRQLEMPIANRAFQNPLWVRTYFTKGLGCQLIISHSIIHCLANEDIKAFDQLVSISNEFQTKCPWMTVLSISNRKFKIQYQELEFVLGITGEHYPVHKFGVLQYNDSNGITAHNGSGLRYEDFRADVCAPLQLVFAVLFQVSQLNSPYHHEFFIIDASAAAIDLHVYVYPNANDWMVFSHLSIEIMQKYARNTVEFAKTYFPSCWRYISQEEFLTHFLSDGTETAQKA